MCTKRNMVDLVQPDFSRWNARSRCLWLLLTVGEHPNPTLLCACRKYIPCVYVVNKVDQITLEELEVMDRMPHYCPVSAHLEWNLDGLLDKIWEYLNLIRVSVLPPRRNPILFPHVRCGLSAMAL
jgi:hypothetical protein